MSALERDALKNRAGGALPPLPQAGPATSGGGRRPLKRKDYSPVHWNQYFEHKHEVKANGNKFVVYECGTQGPLLFFLHGGGFSALSWACLSSTISHLVTCRCAAVDLRGHGDTETDDDKNLSAETLSNDVGDVIKSLYKDDPPPIILIGHSMGGAIAVHTAVKELIPTLIGLVVIDVVEGTAMEALSSMQSFLRGRPTSFKDLDTAIEWAVRSGQIRNLESAKVSMVGQLKRMDTEETATHELEGEEQTTQPPPVTTPSVHETITEEPEDDTFAVPTPPPAQAPPVKRPKNQGKYTWRIDLSKTDIFWKGWFEGLSNKFLSCPAPKLLLLAGVDRLDKDLTIGQMQGKFQMQVLPQSGHAVHEDVPDKVADVLATFMVRHKVAEATQNFHWAFPGC